MMPSAADSGRAGIIERMEHGTKSEPRGWWQVLFSILKAAADEFGADQAGRQAAALAYYTLFSIVPLLFVAVAVTAIALGPPRDALPLDPATGQVACERVHNVPLAPDSERPLDRLVVQLDEVAGESISGPVRELICQARENAGTSLSLGLAIAAFAASGIFLQVQAVLNWVFQVPEEKVSGISGLIRKRLVALVSAIVLAVLVLIPVVSVAAIQFLIDLVPVSTAWLAVPISLAVPLISLVMLVAIVSLTFRVLTQAEIPWKAARRGGAATSLAGLLAAFGVGQYLATIGSDSSTFGVLGGIAILLFFFNLLWIVYVFGAEVTKVYADYLEFGDVVPPHERAESRFVESPPEPVPAPEQVPPKVVNAGVLGFLAGLLVGRRKQD